MTGTIRATAPFCFNILKANRTDTPSQDRSRAALAAIENLGLLVAIP